MASNWVGVWICEAKRTQSIVFPGFAACGDLLVLYVVWMYLCTGQWCAVSLRIAAVTCTAFPHPANPPEVLSIG